MFLVTFLLQCVPGVLSYGVKQAPHEGDDPLPSSAEVKNGWSFAPTSPCAFMASSGTASSLFCLFGFITPVAVFWKPNAIPLSFSTDLVLNFLLSWLLVLLPSTFFLDVLFSFSPVVSIP